MSIPYIGPYYFLAMDGELIAPNALILEEITRPGVAGAAWRIVGQRGRPFRVHTIVDVSTILAAYNLLYNYRGLIGTLNTLIDPLGNTYADCMVLECNTQQPAAFQGGIGGTSGSSSGYLVAADWLLQLT